MAKGQTIEDLDVENQALRNEQTVLDGEGYNGFQSLHSAGMLAYDGAAVHLIEDELPVKDDHYPAWGGLSFVDSPTFHCTT